MAVPPAQVLSVTELTHRVKDLLEERFPGVWVEGEISNFRSPSSGHIYFTLKDANAQLSCVLFRGELFVDRTLLEDGRKVMLGGELTVYESRGQYQLRVTQAELQGAGALQAAFERLKEKLKAEGFAETRLLLTEGKARRSLVKRVDAANNLRADLFLSIHHDSVPNKFLEDWEFEGKKSHFSDRFSGYSVFVSRNNPDFKTSFAFAELIGKEMKAQGFDYAKQYSQAIMGRYQRELLNKETGVYRYDELIVLRKTRMAAVLLEAGSIINRGEELKMDLPERRDIISNAVATAVREFCDPQPVFLGPL